MMPKCKQINTLSLTVINLCSLHYNDAIWMIAASRRTNRSVPLVRDMQWASSASQGHPKCSASNLKVKAGQPRYNWLPTNRRDLHLPPSGRVKFFLGSETSKENQRHLFESDPYSWLSPEHYTKRLAAREQFVDPYSWLITSSGDHENWMPLTLTSPLVEM